MGLFLLLDKKLPVGKIMRCSLPNILSQYKVPAN